MNTEPSRSIVRPIMVALLFGVLVGVAGTLLVPRWLGPRLPLRFRPGNRVEGRVLDKTLDGDRLLLTIQAGDDKYLSTFFERWKEVDFLVEPQDMVTLVVSGNDPFLENPPIEKVRRPAHSGAQRLHDDPAARSSTPADTSALPATPIAPDSLHEVTAPDTTRHERME